MFSITSQDDLESLTRDQLRDPFPSDIGGGADYNPDEYPIPGYMEWAETKRVTPDDADVEVTTYDGLKDALAELKGSGGTIWLDTDEINLRGEDIDRLKVHDDITVASGRGVDEWPTCTIKVAKPNGFFNIVGDGSRLTGFELVGDETEYFDPRDRYPDAEKPIYKVGASNGVQVRGDKTELDNLVVRGFTHAGIFVVRDGASVESPDYLTYIHHCELVDNPADTLGYGVTVRRGGPVITKCFFDNNRHSVAGSGFKNCHYVVSYSIVGPTTSSHALDMHGVSSNSSEYVPLTEQTSDDLKERRADAPTDNVDHAGGRISIHHNVVFPVHQTGFKCRGCPRRGIQMHSNFWLNTPDRAVPAGTGKDGLAWSFRVRGMNRDQVGIDEVNSVHATGDPSGSIGPGFASTDSEEAAKLKEQLQQTQEQLKATKPKADALDEYVGVMQRLQQISSKNPESNETPPEK